MCHGLLGLLMGRLLLAPTQTAALVPTLYPFGLKNNVTCRSAKLRSKAKTQLNRLAPQLNVVVLHGPQLDVSL